MKRPVHCSEQPIGWQNAMELRQLDVGCRPRRLPGVPGPIRRSRVRLGGRHTACCWRSASAEPGLFQCSPHPLWPGKSVSATRVLYWQLLYCQLLYWQPLSYSTLSYFTLSYSTLSYSYSQPLYSCMVSKSMYIRSFRTKLPETNIIAFCLWKIDRSHQVEPPV